MTAAATDVELDQRTRDELAPPCDAHLILASQAHRRCHQPAEWIVRVRTPRLGPCDPVLLCDEHCATAVKHYRSCPVCSRIADLTTERL